MIYRFGSFELDESAGELRNEGRAVSLQPKPLELLRVLVRERARIVTLDELFDHLWPGTAVTPGSLTRAVSLARRAIGDTHKGSMIRSFPKRGYRFMGTVFEIGEAGEANDAEAPRARAAVIPQRPIAPQGDLFVGREDALASLHEAWQRAAAGRGQLVLVQGRAGVGKTRLVEVFADHVAPPGQAPLIARGRDGEGVPAFWLWAQVLRKLAASDAERGDVGSIVATIPELRSLVVGADAPGGAPDLAPEQGRFLFFDGVHQLLARRAREYPLLLVLDDLQWAGEPSLRLLEHLIYEMAGDPILVVATVREESRDADDPVSRSLSLLRQRPHAQSIGLRGFSRGEVAVLLEQLIGRAAPSDLISELVARTEGNPLFVREAVRILAERGALAHPDRIARHGISLPQESLDLIRRTISGLSPEAVSLIGAASALGRAFALRFLAAVVDLTPDRVLDLLDEAAAAGVVEPVPERAGTYRFQHALHREAAYGALSSGERTRLHQRAAQQLERTAEARLDRVLGELAHHHYHSIAVGDPDLTHRRCVQAAERAAHQFAYEEAATHYEHAAEALEHADHIDVDQQLETLLRLGESHRLSGDRERRRAVLAEALDLAVEMGSQEGAARAAIGICDLSEWGVLDETARSAVEKALNMLGDADSVDRVRLNTRLAYFDAVAPHATLEALVRETVERARDLGHPLALQEALYILHFRLSGPDHLDERERLCREVVETAAHTKHSDPALITLLDTACDSLMRGDAVAARAWRDEAQRVSGDTPHPGQLWHLRAHDSGVALMHGRIGDAESLAEEALAFGQRTGHPYARGVHNGLVACVHRERGDAEGVRSVLSGALRARLGAIHWVHAVVARAELVLGQRDEAERLYAGLRRDGFSTIPRNMRFTNSILEVAFLCADLEADADAPALCEILAEIEQQHGVVPIPVCYGGPVAHGLGRLRALLGDVDGAVELLEEAVESSAALGARPARARAERDLARLLLRRGERGRASALLRTAGETAAEIGMTGLTQQLEADRA